jgi:hypothetical protein
MPVNKQASPVSTPAGCFFIRIKHAFLPLPPCFWRSRISDAPLRSRSRCIASGTRGSVGRVRSLIHFSNSPSRSRGACLRPSFAFVLHSPPNEGWAERRETFGCVRGTRGVRHNAAYQALARRLASHDAGRSPLGAPPWLALFRSFPRKRESRKLGPRFRGDERIRGLRHASLRIQDRLENTPSMSEAGNLIAQPRYVVKVFIQNVVTN